MGTWQLPAKLLKDSSTLGLPQDQKAVMRWYGDGVIRGRETLLYMYCAFVGKGKSVALTDKSFWAFYVENPMIQILLLSLAVQRLRRKC